MVRGLIFGSIAFAAAFAIERQMESLTSDLSRYDRIRAMSGEPPLWREQLGNLLHLIAEYGKSRRGDVGGLVDGLQNDLVRYVRISSM